MIKIRLVPEDMPRYIEIRDWYLEAASTFTGFSQKDIISLADDEGAGEETIVSLKSLANQESCKKLYTYLTNNGKINRTNLRRLLGGPEPEELEQGKTSLFESLVEIGNAAGKITDREGQAVCQRIFNYKAFTARKKEAYELLKRLDVRVCPYCNRQYTMTLGKSKEDGRMVFKTIRPELDHYFPKGVYPYFSTSLFNLVPSCHICNHNKGEAEDLLYLYEEGFSKDLAFHVIPEMHGESDDDKAYKFNALLGYLFGENDRFLIRFMKNDELSLLGEENEIEDRLDWIEDEKYRSRVINTVKLLELEAVYSQHKEEIRHLLRRSYIFNTAYIENVVVPLMHKKLKRQDFLNATDDESKKLARMLVFPSLTGLSEHDRRLMSRLTYDILEQMRDSDTSMEEL